MKLYCVLFFLLSGLMLACSSSRVGVEKSAEIQLDYEVLRTGIYDGQDTFYTEELRIYKIRSSWDGMLMMYENYGDWSEKYVGKYNEKADQLLWKEVDLLDDGMKYSVWADGTETMSEYFVSLIVFDAENKNCLSPDYPRREMILEKVLRKMKTTNRSVRRYTRLQKLLDL